MEGKSTSGVSLLDEVGGLELRHVRLVPDGDDAVLAQSRGQVSRGTVDDSTFRPVPGGVLCERIFGELYLCSCGREEFHERSRKAYGDVQVCKGCGKPLPRNERSDRFGHIALSEPIAHPFAPHAPALSVLPVLPPGLRRLRALDDPRSTEPREWLERESPDVTSAYVRVLDTVSRRQRLGELGAAPILLEAESDRVRLAIQQLFARLLEDLGGVPGIVSFLRSLEGAIENGEASLVAPGPYRLGILRLRGIGMDVSPPAGWVPEPVWSHVIFLRNQRSIAQLRTELEAPELLERASLHSGDQALALRAFDLEVRVVPVTDAELAQLKATFPKPEAAEATMALRVEYSVGTGYRGQLWQAANGSGRVFYETPFEVIEVTERLAALEGALCLDRRFERLFHR